MPGLIADAVEALRRVEDASNGHALDTAVREFVGVVRTVPDYGASDLPAEAIPALSKLAEQVIEHIEKQIDKGSDRPAIQRDLAAAIYEIRAALEEADRWSRHYGR